MDRRTVLICRAGLHLSAVPGVGKEGREGRGGARREGGISIVHLTHSIHQCSRRRFI